jgi:hypothetical protein
MIPGLVDMWIAVHSDLFVGQVFSTFDQAICWMRGPDKATASNICAGMIDHFTSPVHQAYDEGEYSGGRYVNGLIV